MVSNSDEIHKAFGDELASLVMPVATDIKIEVEYNKRIVFSQLYGFPMYQKSDSKLSLKMKNCGIISFNKIIIRSEIII